MRSNTITVVLSLIAGFAGAALFQQFVRPAQAAPAVQQVLTARDFRLIDNGGNVIAELAPSKTHIFRAELRITGYDGHTAELGATNLIFGAHKGGELGLGYLQDKNGNPTTTAIFFEQQAHPRMAIEADGPGITMYGAKPFITLNDESNNKLWSAP